MASSRGVVDREKKNPRSRGRANTDMRAFALHEEKKGGAERIRHVVTVRLMASIFNGLSTS